MNRRAPAFAFTWGLSSRCRAAPKLQPTLPWHPACWLDALFPTTVQYKKSTVHPNGALSTQNPEAESALPASSSSDPAADMPAWGTYSSVTTTTMISDTYVQNPSSSNVLVIDQSELAFAIRKCDAGRGDLCQQNEFGKKSGQGAW